MIDVQNIVRKLWSPLLGVNQCFICMPP